jgi:hypothetical protein
MRQTAQALKAAKPLGWENHLRQVFREGSSTRRKDYAKGTFMAQTKVVPPQKLSFLQYVSDENVDWWR